MLGCKMMLSMAFCLGAVATASAATKCSTNGTTWDAQKCQGSSVSLTLTTKTRSSGIAKCTEKANADSTYKCCRCDDCTDTVNNFCRCWAHKTEVMATDPGGDHSCIIVPSTATTGATSSTTGATSSTTGAVSSGHAAFLDRKILSAILVLPVYVR